MPIPDEETVWQLYTKYGGALRRPIEAQMRKMRVPPDPCVVNDIALDACCHFLKRPAGSGRKEPLLYLVGIARNLVKALYLRGPTLSNTNRIGTRVVSIEGTTEEQLNDFSEDPMQDLANEIDLEGALKTLKNKKPDQHRVLSGRLAGKSTEELQLELNVGRDRINYLLKRAMTYVRNYIAGKEKES
jgi:DNA-directed RNA polymerase specialized sigma24 family protein